MAPPSIQQNNRIKKKEEESDAFMRLVNLLSPVDPFEITDAALSPTKKSQDASATLGYLLRRLIYKNQILRRFSRYSNGSRNFS